MIPTTLKLNDSQVAAAEAFIKSHPSPPDYEPDCCSTSRFWFSVRGSGVGDTVHIHDDLSGDKLFLDEDLWE
jgi:hypothetical protein